MTDLEVVEICAGAGGQALGLERAGFEHALAVELDGSACATLRANRPGWKVAQGDVADPEVWEPEAYAGVDLVAGGVPCPRSRWPGGSSAPPTSGTCSPGRSSCAAGSGPARCCWRTCAGSA